MKGGTLEHLRKIAMSINGDMLEKNILALKESRPWKIIRSILYKEFNIKSCNQYKRYNSGVPTYLHNRPKSVVAHIMKRLDSAANLKNITRISPRFFTVVSGSEKYQVWLGSDTHLPTCQCADYKSRKLPCKQLCAVVQRPDTGWKSLGSFFTNNPLLNLDTVVLEGSDVEHFEQHPVENTEPAVGTQECMENNVNDADVHVPSVTVQDISMIPLPKRKKYQA
eukprot:gene12577-13866_t